MSTVKLTKTELRAQQLRLSQLEKYLPTLQLKKAMLQYEVNLAQAEISKLTEAKLQVYTKAERFSPLLSEKVRCDVKSLAEVLHVKKRYENIAGVEIPILDGVVFRESAYFCMDSSVWVESAGQILKELALFREKLVISKEKKWALEKELKEVSIRVNLFEKILIPRAKENIKKIKIFLGDQQLAAVAAAKVAKQKILLKKEMAS